MDKNDYITNPSERKKGKHLTAEDRGAIQALRKEGYGVRAIARNIGCAPGTITYELRRGTPERKGARGRPPGYSAKHGEKVYKSNRSRCHRRRKAEQCKPFIRWVERQFREHKWSPDSSYGYAKRIQEIGTASLKNYVLLYKKWFGKDLSSYNFYLMPLSFVSIPKETDIIILNAEEKNFFNFVDDLEDKNLAFDGEYSITLNTTVKFTKSTSKEDIKVALSHDKDAIKVNLTEEEIRNRYPFDYASLTEKCKKRYNDFVMNNDYHKNRRRYENDLKCAYIRYLDPSNPKSGRKIFYNDAMLSRLDNHYTRR